MTNILLPKLLEKKGGVIVNLSSSAAEVDAPMFTVYNATKVTFFELSLHNIMPVVHHVFCPEALQTLLTFLIFSGHMLGGSGDNKFLYTYISGHETSDLTILVVVI